MKSRTLQWSLIGLAGATLVFAYAASGTGQEPKATTNQATTKRKVVKTDAEWRKLLTRDQYLVTRHAETEPPFDNKYWNNHAKGIYECVCCQTELFTSKTKFDSGTGWPSFYAPVSQKNVETSTDYNLGYARTEVLCSTCGAHLGHVFNDALETPTGLRFCMNSASLKFVKEAPPAKKEKAAKTAEKPADKTAEKASEKPAEKTTDKPAEKTDTPAKPAPATESPK